MLEMLVSMGIFLLICASAFTLLGVSQQKYQTESQLLTSFEEARLGLDQIVRDVNDSGLSPALNQFQAIPDASLYADTPVAWSPGYHPSNPPTVSQLMLSRRRRDALSNSWRRRHFY